MKKAEVRLLQSLIRHMIEDQRDSARICFDQLMDMAENSSSKPSWVPKSGGDVALVNSIGEGSYKIPEGSLGTVNWYNSATKIVSVIFHAYGNYNLHVDQLREPDPRLNAGVPAPILPPLQPYHYPTNPPDPPVDLAKKLRELALKLENGTGYVFYSLEGDVLPNGSGGKFHAIEIRW